LEFQESELKGETRTEFLTKAGIELERARRYKVFVSASVLDLSPAGKALGLVNSPARLRVGDGIKKLIRSCDYAAYLGADNIALLFPETSRQGAEIVTKRITKLIQDELSMGAGGVSNEIIPVEIASYPDTAGARSLSELLTELSVTTKQ